MTTTIIIAGNPWDIVPVNWRSASIDPGTRRIMLPRRATAADAAAAVSLAWEAAIAAYAAELRDRWNRFEQMADAIDQDLSGELSEDDGPEVFSAFEDLRRRGVRFDPSFATMLVDSQRQLAEAVDGQEDDDPAGSDDELPEVDSDTTEGEEAGLEDSFPPTGSIRGQNRRAAREEILRSVPTSWTTGDAIRLMHPLRRVF